MQSWRGEKAKGREQGQCNGEQRGHRFSSQRSQQRKEDGRNDQSGIRSSPMRQSRLKPPPGSANLINGVPIELLSSPSRGLDTTVDPTQNLTNPETQQTFREYISKMFAQHKERFGALLVDAERLFPIRCPPAQEEATQPTRSSSWAAAGLCEKSSRSLQEILLLVRRLREGCVAAGRCDEFAREVYMLSTLLSVLIGDNVQLGASLSRFVSLMETADVQSCCDIELLLSGKRDASHHARFDRDQAHSLLLLWLSIYGGQAERLGGRQRQMHAGHSSLAYQTHRRSMRSTSGPHVQFAEACHRALANDDVIALRGLLIQAQFQHWHTALLRRCVEEKRAKCWATMKKAYMHLAIDGDLLDLPASWSLPLGPRDWLERMLLVDIELVLPTKEEKARYASDKPSNDLRNTPDAWDDDSVDHLASTFEASSLNEPRIILNIRSARLANVLTAYGLAEAAVPSATSCELDKWRGRVTTQAGVPVLKLR